MRNDSHDKGNIIFQLIKLKGYDKLPDWDYTREVNELWAKSETELRKLVRQEIEKE